MAQQFQLKNGLKVLLVESHKSPVVSIQSWVRTGSADEGKKEEGISHFIEHLVFKGTRKFKMGEIASQIEGAGGELNAYTSFDETVFYVTISKHFADVGLESISDMMGFPLFDKDEIEAEREVVIEEIKRGKDSLGRRASQLLFSTSFQKHPYGVPVIGFEKNVRNWSAKKIRDFYHSRYSPKNMFVVVVGDFEPKEMKKKVENYFGEFKTYPVKRVVRKKEPKLKGVRLKIEKTEFKQSVAYLSWKIPTSKHKDIPALEAMSLILGQGDSSRLVHKLRIEEATVNSIGSMVFSAKDEGVFAISMGYQPEKLTEALSKITTELLRFRDEGASGDELTKAITNFAAEKEYALETVDGISRRVGDSFMLMNDPDYYKKSLQKMLKLNTNDLQKAFVKYIDPDNMVIVAASPEDESTLKQALKTWNVDFKKAWKKTKAKKLKPQKSKAPKFQTKAKKSMPPETRKMTLSNGVTVLLRPSFDTQVISVKAAMLGGIRAEPENHDGLTELLGRAWMGGTKRRTEQEIYVAIEGMAGGLQPISGKNSIGMGVDILAPKQLEACELFLDCLTQPLFPKDVIEREKGIQLDQIKNRADNPSQLAVSQFLKGLYGSHPYHRDALGTIDTVTKIEQSHLLEYWNRLNHRHNTTLILTGAFDESMWLKKIEAATNSWKEGKKFDQVLPFTPPVKNQTFFRESKKEQSHLIVGYPGLTLRDADRFALQVMQSILAGQGGRLFLELRDKNSLAYSVSPLRVEGLERGYFGAYIGCSPEKVLKAKEMMHIEFQKLCDTRISDLELERSQRYLVGRNDIDLQRTSTVASSILYDDIYGIDYNETFTVDEHYFAVTAADVQKIAQKIFSQPSIVSLVGPDNCLE